tara:strand:- start:143 stop:496 length:354 start_codon:yes stop_codon:yes gene_type:complete
LEVAVQVQQAHRLEEQPASVQFLKQSLQAVVEEVDQMVQGPVIQEVLVGVEQMVVLEDQVMQEDFQKQKVKMAEIQGLDLLQEQVVVEHSQLVVMYLELLFQEVHLTVEVLEHQIQF